MLIRNNVIKSVHCTYSESRGSADCLQTRTSSKKLHLYTKQHLTEADIAIEFERPRPKTRQRKREITNMASIISSHNKKILEERRKKEEPKKMCNCQRGVASCPLNGKCQLRGIVYKATATSDNGETKTYTGCTDCTFK